MPRTDVRGPWTAWVVASLLLLLVVAGCGNDRARTAAGPAPADGVQGAPEPLPAAVEETLDAVAKLRGLSPPPSLRARVVTREQMPAAFEAAFTDEDRAWFARTTTLYRLLGYLRADQDYYTLYLSLAESSILGFYNPLEDALVVGAEGGTASFDALSADERGVLAHELVHAIQDHHFRLDEKLKLVQDDLDRNLAFLAVVEGDATTHQRLFGRRAGVGVGPLIFVDARLATQRIPLAINRELQFPYTTGADWITGLRSSGGTAAIDRLLETPPQGTWQALHPDRAAFTPADVKLPDLTRALGDGWQRESGGTFGEFHWGNFLQTRLRGLDSLSAAATWAGDRYDVYANGRQSVAIFNARQSRMTEALLSAAVGEWLRGSGGQFSERDGVAASVTSDGRTFLLLQHPDGFLFVVGSSEALARKALQAIFSG